LNGNNGQPESGCNFVTNELPPYAILRLHETIPKVHPLKAILNRFFRFAGVILPAFISINFSTALAQPRSHDTNPGITNPTFVVGEELEYKVTYLTFTLGRLIVTVDSMVVENGRSVWITHVRMDSREGLPFVSLHTIYESHMEEAGFTRLAIGSQKEKTMNGAIRNTPPIMITSLSRLNRVGLKPQNNGSRYIPPQSLQTGWRFCFMPGATRNYKNGLSCRRSSGVIRRIPI